MTSKQALVQTKAAEPAWPVAGVNARVSAYLVDSLVLAGFILVFFIAAGAVLLFSSSNGKHDPPDSAYYAFIAIFLIGTLLAWSVFNLVLLRWRGQTAGMYVIGLQAVGDDGVGLTTGRVFVRWFALHPLLFHPLLLPLWGIGAAVVVAITLSQAVLVIALALALLCVVSPLAALAAALLDPERRTISDRLARTLVVPLDRP